jgi:hypothetical protein
MGRFWEVLSELRGKDDAREVVTDVEQEVLCLSCLCNTFDVETIERLKHEGIPNWQILEADYIQSTQGESA